MEESGGVTIGVLAERLEGVRQDVAELRQQRREDHHRLRGVEAAVSQMLDAQKMARDSEQRQYRRLGNRIALCGVLVTFGLLILTAVTVAVHNG